MLPGRLKRDRRGALAVETAIATAVVIGLLLSGIEVNRYVLRNQKIEPASATMADLVSPEPSRPGRLAAALLVAGDDQCLTQPLAPCPWRGPCATPYVPAHGHSRTARP